jgi:hypothetical protein
MRAQLSRCGADQTPLNAVTETKIGRFRFPILIRDPASTTRDRPPFHIFTAHRLNEFIVSAMFRTYDHETRFDEMSHKTTVIVPLSKNNRNLTTEPIRMNSLVIETKTRSQYGD